MNTHLFVSLPPALMSPLCLTATSLNVTSPLLTHFVKVPSWPKPQATDPRLRPTLPIHAIDPRLRPMPLPSPPSYHSPNTDMPRFIWISWVSSLIQALGFFVFLFLFFLLFSSSQLSQMAIKLSSSTKALASPILFVDFFILFCCFANWKCDFVKVFGCWENFPNEFFFWLLATSSLKHHKESKNHFNLAKLAWICFFFFFFVVICVVIFG